MSYELYHTEGVIIGSRNVGEADKIFSVFTKDFGKINLQAKGVRLLKSKLRPHLNLFDWSNFSFISAREYWRLLDVKQKFIWENYNPFEFKARAMMASLIERMVKGEEKDIEIWRLIRNSLLFINNKGISLCFKEFEAIFTIRFLFQLGYISSDYEFLKARDKEIIYLLAASVEWNEEILKSASKIHISLKRIINDAFETSQL